MDLASNPKGRSYPNIARPGGIDKTAVREEMSARRTPKWASRPPGKVSIPVVRKRVTRCRATIGRLQQHAVSTNRRARWRSCPLAIGASKEPSDSNQELDCRRKMASCCSANCGQQSCNERFQRCAGSLNCGVTYCKRGRRCLVAISAYKYLKIGKQVFVCRG